jgi:hypothetical protein
MFRFGASITVASSKTNDPVKESDVRMAHHTFMFSEFVWVFTPPNLAVVPVHFTGSLEGFLIREDSVLEMHHHHQTCITFSA